jgi:hypothetical protein
MLKETKENNENEFDIRRVHRSTRDIRFVFTYDRDLPPNVNS